MYYTISTVASWGVTRYAIWPNEWRLEHAREQREDAVDGTGLQQSVSIVDVK